MIRVRWSALSVAVLLAGCSLAPRHERPALPVAAQFPLAPAAAPGAPPADIAWPQYFTDPRLQRLIGLALQHNRDLRVAVLNIEAARAQAGLRRADEWPTVALAATGSRQTGAGGHISSSYTVGLGMSAYELDLFGRVRSASDAALAQLAASEAARQAAQVALVASVAGLHHALSADVVLVGLTERTLASRAESLRLTQLRFDNGVISEAELQAARSLVEGARATLAQLRRQQALDRNALELLVGQPLPADLPAAGAWSAQALADVPVGLPSEVLLRRPDVQQAEQQLVAAEANIGAARAAFWPRITLTASAGTASSELSGLFSGTAWSFAPQLLMPLFDADRNRAALQLSETQRDIAVAQYERTVQAAFREVADALAGRSTLAEQLRAQQAQATAEAARLKLATLRFEHGVASSLELLDAERSYFAAQQAVVQVQLALLQNRIALYRALGGGAAR